MKFGIGLATSVLMPINSEGATASGVAANSDIYIGLIYVEVEFKNCTIEVFINDIPVSRYTSDDKSFQSELVSGYLVGGSNNLEIVVNPGPTPAENRNKFEGVVKDDIFVATRLVQYRDGEYVDGEGGKTLTHILWNGNEHKSVSFPHILSLSTELPSTIPLWSWQQSDLSQLSRDQNEVLKVIQEFHEGYQNLDAHTIFNLIKIVLKEDNLVHYKGDVPSMDDWHNNIINDMNRHKKKEKGIWKLKPLNPKDFSLRLCANNHLIECIAKDWHPIIRSNAPLVSGNYFYYKLFVGKLNGKWSILNL